LPGIKDSSSWSFSFYTNNPNLATPLRRQKQDYWIREMGTATPHDCSDKIDGIDILDHRHLFLVKKIIPRY
jgi:hypothetical protein